MSFHIVQVLIVLIAFERTQCDSFNLPGCICFAHQPQLSDCGTCQPPSSVSMFFDLHILQQLHLFIPAITQCIYHVETSMEITKSVAFLVLELLIYFSC